MFINPLLLTSVLPLTQAAETILGVYIFSRHGDRTAKMTPPANLTDLGYQEVYTSGQYFRDRYVSSSATSRVHGLNTDLVKLSQISASAPLDDVLMPSAIGFLQGLYPPVGSKLGSQELRNGTIVQSPLNGYQIIPIQQTTSGTGSEDAAWLQGASNCANAIISSNNYYQSPEYKSLLTSTQSFYESLVPLVNHTFTTQQTSFKNAYTIFDLLNVASIHNSTTQSPWLSNLTNSTLDQSRTLADNHEFNLAYNASDPIRAIAGKTLAAEILQGLNTTITTQGKTKMTIEFGAYGSFQSFFGLAQLTSTNPDFYGVPDYTSTMTFELFTNADVSGSSFPATSDLQVRFLFHNGTTSNSSEPVAYPLFGRTENELSWADFQSGMQKFAVGTQTDWCKACGNTTGVCAGADALSSDGGDGASPSSGGSGGGMSKAVAGVIGAMVTLAVILGVEMLILLLGGFRLVSKKRLAGAGQNGIGTEVRNGKA
ncbi:MAG: hypothetical protein MMC23_008397 [Stictis urceolatum]|nr:hypothetical protein [Stictis urceolata]